MKKAGFFRLECPPPSHHARRLFPVPAHLFPVPSHLFRIPSHLSPVTSHLFLVHSQLFPFPSKLFPVPSELPVPFQLFPALPSPFLALPSPFPSLPSPLSSLPGPFQSLPSPFLSSEPLVPGNPGLQHNHSTGPNVEGERSGLYCRYLTESVQYVTFQTEKLAFFYTVFLHKAKSCSSNVRFKE